MKIVVGLGNPGRKYAGTRHNVGFEVLEVLARQSAERWRSRFEAELLEVQLAGERTLLVAPQTYMNLSGRSVRSVVEFYKTPISDLLVISDDLNLPVGKLRLRASGTAGGQKGLKNIIDQLGTTEFARLRVGIGRPPAGADAVNYVLQSFAKAERPQVEEAIQRAVEATERWVASGVDAAMNAFNRNHEAGGGSTESPAD